MAQLSAETLAIVQQQLADNNFPGAYNTIANALQQQTANPGSVNPSIPGTQYLII
jgi:hypothetical protein